MKKMYSIILIIVYSVLVHSPLQGQEPWVVPAWADTLKNPVVPGPKALAEGKKIYESICWTCHGMTGKGDGPAAARLNPPPADHSSAKTQSESDGSLYWKITRGRGNMQPFEKSLTRDQRWKLVYYIRSLGKIQTGLK